MDINVIQEAESVSKGFNLSHRHLSMNLKIMSDREELGGVKVAGEVDSILQLIALGYHLEMYPRLVKHGDCFTGELAFYVTLPTGKKKLAFCYYLNDQMLFQSPSLDSDGYIDAVVEGQSLNKFGHQLVASLYQSEVMKVSKVEE